MIDNFLEQFICGRKFQNVSNFIIDTNRSVNFLDLKDKNIIWCKTDYLSVLFNGVLNSKNKYILITHNSDYPISYDLFKNKPECIKKWFAQNVDFKHDDLIPLPIGLENDIGPSKGIFSDYKVLEKYINTNKSKIEDKIYCNFNEKNHSSRLNILKNAENKQEFFIDKYQDYKSYCCNMLKYKYILSPRGNGIDCHRTWEALYLGSSPIVPRHFMYDGYTGLPIIQLDLLNMNLSNILDKKIEPKYDQLSMSYWEKIILKERSLL